MRKTLRILAFVAGGIILLIGGVAAFIWFDGIPTYDATLPENLVRLEAPRDSAHVARGAKIASLLCNECHTGETGRLTGKKLLDAPTEFGEISSYNITQHKEKGIGNWTDGQLYYFIRTGIRADGSWAQLMPKFPLMADDDVLSVIAWLRSEDNPKAQPDPAELPKNNPNFLVRFLAHVAMFPPAFPEAAIAVPDSMDQVAFGRYIANGMCGCFGCHSADFKTLNETEPEKSGGFYGGGNPMVNLDGELVPSANITMDTETGIGAWTEEEFVAAVRYNKNPKGGNLHYPMFPHVTLTDTEAKAIFAYLKTVPPLKNKVERYQAAN